MCKWVPIQNLLVPPISYLAIKQEQLLEPTQKLPSNL
jgi:hypothetical protein